MANVNCSACGASIPRDPDPNSWGAWCIPCQSRIKLETPWYHPSMRQQDYSQAEAKWKLEHGVKQLLELESCPFCGTEQGDYDRPVAGSGPRLSTFARGPYVIECRCGAMGSPSPTPELAAQMWNNRAELAQKA